MMVQRGGSILLHHATNNTLFVVVVVLLLSFSVDSNNKYGVVAFVHVNPLLRPVVSAKSRLFPLSSVDISKETDLWKELSAMRVKEIKAELSALQIPTRDVFEKEELVERLYKARLEGKKAPNTTSSSQDNNKPGVISTPLYFTQLDSDVKLAAVNMDGGIQVEVGEQPYATIQIDVGHSNGKTFPLSLLLDTACSGFVLRPSVVFKYDLPSLQSPITMTGAGGTEATTKLSQLESFSVGEHKFGKLPAAVQDIGTLPSSLDGIIGLSFLSQFACVEMDFQKGQLNLTPKGNAATNDNNDKNNETMVILSDADMELLPSLGIYSVNVYLDGRGPVKMLVDTGAACTFINWKGVADLGLSRDTSLLERLSSPMAAMGSDNIAMELTHRIMVKNKIQLGSSIKRKQEQQQQGNEGLSLEDNDSMPLKIDIGNIAILDSLATYNIGGILGIDCLMRCTKVRFYFQGGQSSMQLLK